MSDKVNDCTRAPCILNMDLYVCIRCIYACIHLSLYRSFRLLIITQIYTHVQTIGYKKSTDEIRVKYLFLFFFFCFMQYEIKMSFFLVTVTHIIILYSWRHIILFLYISDIHTKNASFKNLFKILKWEIKFSLANVSRLKDFKSF